MKKSLMTLAALTTLAVSSISQCIAESWEYSYLPAIGSKVGAHWYPLKHTGEGSVKLTFKLNHDGSIQDVTVAKSSGNPDVDKTAIKAVRKAAPFTAMPEAAPKDLDITCEMKYRDNKRLTVDLKGRLGDKGFQLLTTYPAADL